MAVVGVAVGIAGLIYGFLSFRSAQGLKKELIQEKALLKEKILDIRQVWKGYFEDIQNAVEKGAEISGKTFSVQMRMEDIKGHMSILDRFIERLERLS